MNRRSILKTGLLTASIPSLPKVVQSAPLLKNTTNLLDGNYLNLVKKGHPKHDNTFLYSLMHVRDIASESRFISELFDRHNYKVELKYSSNDRYKKNISIELFRHVLNSRNYNFQINMFNSDVSNYKNLNPESYNSAILRNYGSLDMAQYRGTPIVMKAEDNFGPSSRLKADFNTALASTCDYTAANKDRFLQINDLIAGCIFAIKGRRLVESSLKRDINENFLSTIRITPELSDENIENINIKVIK